MGSALFFHKIDSSAVAIYMLMRQNFDPIWSKLGSGCLREVRLYVHFEVYLRHEMGISARLKKIIFVGVYFHYFYFFLPKL